LVLTEIILIDLSLYLPKHGLSLPPVVMVLQYIYQNLIFLLIFSKAEKIVVVPQIADSINEGTLKQWSKSK
jgi:hypothetical protein